MFAQSFGPWLWNKRLESASFACHHCQGRCIWYTMYHMMYRGHYKHDRTLLNAIIKASSGTARRSRNGSEALRPTVWWHVEDKHHRDLEKRVFIKYGEIHLKLPTLWILLVSKKNLKKKTGNYMHGSTVPCPILCMCLLSSLLMFGSASLFIIKNWGHVSSMKSVKNKENHSRGELLMLGS